MFLVGTTSGVFKVNCMNLLPAIQSSEPEHVKSIVRAPWDPTRGQEACVLDFEPLSATEPIAPRQSSQTERTRNHAATILHSKTRKITITQMHVSGATQPVRDEWQNHTVLQCRDWIESAILS